jgi:spore germination cell wall hydrolase CwlJ-like protein
MKTFTKISLLVNSLVLLFLIVFGVGQMQNAQAESILSNINDKDRYCLQQNIYFEARNQSEMGMIAVAWVTMNRTDSKRYPNNICSVVWQKKQFSWTHDGLSDKPGKNIIEQRAWKRAGYVTSLVLHDWAYGKEGAVKEATHYHADYVNPYWASSFQKVAHVDNHIFYRK